MYFLYSLGGVTFNKCWITLSILNCYSPNYQGFILMKNALNDQMGMLGDMFLWLVANLKQGVIYFIKREGGNHKIAWVYNRFVWSCLSDSNSWRIPLIWLVGHWNSDRNVYGVGVPKIRLTIILSVAYRVRKVWQISQPWRLVNKWLL